MRFTFVVISRVSRAEWHSTATVTSMRAVFKSHYIINITTRRDLEDLLRATRHKTANGAHARSRSNLCNGRNNSLLHLNAVYYNLI